MVVAAFEVLGNGDLGPLILSSKRGQKYVDAFVEASENKTLCDEDTILYTFEDEEEAREVYTEFEESDY